MRVGSPSSLESADCINPLIQSTPTVWWGKGMRFNRT